VKADEVVASPSHRVYPDGYAARGRGHETADGGSAEKQAMSDSYDGSSVGPEEGAGAGGGRVDLAQTRIADPTGCPLPGRRVAATAQPERYKLGDRLGDRYEVLAIHRGGMGVVYGTLDHVTHMAFALKTLQARFAGDARMRQLFATEAAIWVQLEKHPYIARAFRVETFDDMPYVLTEYVRGRPGKGSDLRGWLGSPELTLPVGVGFASEIAQGMLHAGQKVSGLVHRDLKPANVLVNERGAVKVTDFGLVAAMAADAGTPAYMAPEQWRGEKLDLRTDIYAYGCILYEIFTGYHLFAARSVEELRSAHLERRPHPPRALNPRLSAELERLVLCCLEKSPPARPSSWKEVVDACEHEFFLLTGRRLELDSKAFHLDATELLNAGTSLCQLGRHAESLELWERALRLQPADASLVADLLINKGLTFRDLGRGEDAIRMFEDVERRYTGTSEIPVLEKVAKALTAKAQVLGKLGRSGDALVTNDQVVERFGAAQEGELQECVALALYNKGVELNRIERRHDAIRIYEEITERFQHASEIPIREVAVKALRNRGHALDELGRRQEALRVFDDLIERFGGAEELAIRVQVATTLCAKGPLLADLGRADDEDRAYLEVVTRFGEAAQGALRDCVAIALFNRAVRAGERGHREDELQMYQDIVARFGNAPELALRMHVATALSNTASRLCQLGREDQALRAYDEVVARFGAATETPLQQRVATALYAKGHKLAARGHIQNAVQTYGQLIRRFGAARDPAVAHDVARALLNAALLFDRLGHTENATRAYDELVRRVVPRCERCNASNLGCTRLGGAGIGVKCRKCSAEYRLMA